METALIIGSIQGAILSGILFFKKENHNANRILSILVLVFSFSIFIHAISHQRSEIDIPFHSVLISAIFFLLGPLLYLYTLLLTKNKHQLSIRDLSHILPFLAAITVYILSYIFFEPADKIPKPLGYISDLVALSVSIYAFLTIKALVNHSKRIKDNFSSTVRMNLNWLKILIGFYLLLWVGAIISDFIPHSHKNWDYESLLFAGFIYLIGYAALLQPEIFRTDIELVSFNEPFPKKKYQKSTLTEEMALKYSGKIVEAMQQEKLFLKNDLTLPELSEKLAISVHHISQIINEQYNQNFFEFVNKFRIEEAKKLISEPGEANLTLAAISFESGFNSVSSFNSAFKKFMGVSPSQYRKQFLN